MYAMLDRTNPDAPPNVEDHGPECPFGNGKHPWRWCYVNKEWRRVNGQGHTECQCVACHCGPRHQPGGLHGTCQRCGRKPL